MVAERRKKLTDDLTSALLEAEIDGDRLTDDEIIGVHVPDGDRRQRDHHQTACQCRILGPQEPRPARAGLRRPRAESRCGSRRRCATTRPARSWPGRSSGELTFYDTTIPDGDVLLLLSGLGPPRRAGLREPRRLPSSAATSVPSCMSFGSGAHFCLGAHLARMEARVALAELFKRIRGYEVDEANAVRVHSSNVRGFAHLPITVRRPARCLVSNPLPDRRPALVAGASSGIGAATAIELAAHGFPVALGARRVEKCQELVDQIRADGGEAVALPPRRHRSRLGQGLRRAGHRRTRRDRGAGRRRR